MGSRAGKQTGAPEQAAKTAGFGYQETFHNTRRLHSALAYGSSAEFEEGRMEEVSVA